MKELSIAVLIKREKELRRLGFSEEADIVADEIEIMRDFSAKEIDEYLKKEMV